MANEQSKILVEQLKNLVQSLNYTMAGYSIGPTELSATVKINVKDRTQNEQDIVGIQFRRLVATQAWTVTAMQKFDDELVFTVIKEI